ncbi:MAG: hypothetical protein AAGI38_02605 [Bacteroidota bacterium]
MKKRTSSYFFYAWLMCMLFSLQTVMAQTQMDDVVYLKNGSIIRGTIVEQVIGEYVKIELMGGSIFVFKETEVDKITREASARPVPQLEETQYAKLSLPRRERPYTFRERGIYNLGSMAFAFGQHATGSFAMNYSVLYRTGFTFKRSLAVGAGLGVDFYREGLTVPVILDVHGDLGRPSRIMPHYFVNVGYGFGAGIAWDTEQFDGGLMGHAGIGWKINTRNRTDWAITLGYKFQQTDQITNQWIDNPGQPGTFEPIRIEGERTYRRIIAQVTFGF